MNTKIKVQTVISPDTAPANTMYTKNIDMRELSEVIFAGTIAGEGAKYTMTAEGIDDDATPKVCEPIEFSYTINDGEQKIADPEKGVEVNASEDICVYINSQWLGKVGATDVRLKFVKKTAGTALSFFACNLGARY